MKKALLSLCLVVFATVSARAEEHSSGPLSPLGSAALSGYVDTSAQWLGQSDPGPATGGGIDRFYDDGFVCVDAFGNVGGYTWFWGCENASQLQGSFIAFHSQSVLDASTIQLVTDIYNLGEIIPPLAPYSGSFEGPGPLLPDAPFSRTITMIPEPSFSVLLLAGVMLGGTFARQRRVKMD